MKPVRWSSLKHMAQSPEHYKHALKTPIVPTPAMRRGSLVHALTLGVQYPFVVFDKPRRGNAWKDFKAEHEGVDILTPDEFALGNNIAAAVKADPEAAKVLRGGEYERTLQWEIAGRQCEGRTDICGKFLADLKVSNSSEPRWFRKHATKMQWREQLMWYRDGLVKYGGGTEPEHISIIAVEPKPPHVVTVFDFNEADREYGQKNWRLHFERLMVCEENDFWPGYVQGITELGVPEWILEEMEDEAA
jgi:hypothetical protein